MEKKKEEKKKVKTSETQRKQAFLFETKQTTIKQTKEKKRGKIPHSKSKKKKTTWNKLNTNVK